MSAGKTYWWAKDAAWLDREAVVELGVQFGPGGPLVEACAPDAHAELELVEGSIPDSLKGVEDAVGCKECGNWAHDPYEESIACARHNPAVWMTKEDFHPKLLRNRDQWQQLATFVTQHTVTFHWIKGHDGIELNERCDKLAGEARREMLKLTYGGTLSVRPKLATQPTITPEPGQVIDVVWGGGFRMTPAIYLREGEVATFIDGKKKVWKLPDGAIFRRRPFAIQPDLLRFADKELRSADA